MYPWLIDDEKSAVKETAIKLRLGSQTIYELTMEILQQHVLL